MTKKEAQRRIKKLKKTIKHHRYLYHVLDKQEISEDVLDSLKHELYKLEQKYPDLITPDSPTQRIGGKPLDKFEKVTHKEPMLSLEDVFSKEEVQDWLDYINRISDQEIENFFCEWKIDGLAASLVYKNGLFVQGATRGNVQVGENVTQNLKTVDAIPLKLKLHKSVSKEIDSIVKDKIKEGRIEVRGEVYITKKGFKEINQKRLDEGKDLYANPRNLAAGSIRQLDPKIAARRNLHFLAWNLVTDCGQITHQQEHQILTALGFKTDSGRLAHNLSQIVSFREEMKEKKEELPFQVDGIVINVNDNQLFKELGVTGKSPRGARAFKFPPEQATTKVEDIEVQVGRSGRVTPVAFLEPVDIRGVTITRATLHNIDEIRRLDVRVGDTVIVERAGDVIPHITKVLTDLREGHEKKFQMPQKCPICETRLITKEDEVAWRCPNPNCRVRRERFLEHFVSKKAFDIEGLGEKIIKRLLDEQLISDAPDIFRLQEGDLIPLEGFENKSAQNIIKAIDDSREIEFYRFLIALGIPQVGEKTALDITDHFKNLSEFKNTSQEELENIKDIGPIVAKNIKQWFKDDKNKELIKELLENGVRIKYPNRQSSHFLKGQKFVFTGSLEHYTREEAKRAVRQRGGDPVSSVSKETDFVVCGENPGSKKKKAQEKNIPVLNEKDFKKMLKNED